VRFSRIVGEAPSIRLTWIVRVQRAIQHMLINVCCLLRLVASDLRFVLKVNFAPQR
jgi:hypothetical protein